MLRNARVALLIALGFLSAQAGAPRKVLFLCTGNFFRSAFAERYFNFLSEQNQKLDPADPRRKPVPWTAESRGLDIDQLSPSQRSQRMSSFALERLKQLKIPVETDAASGKPRHAPRALTAQDLDRSHKIIAMHRPTHRSMLKTFLEKNASPGKGAAQVLASVVFWEIEDVSPSPAIPVSREEQAKRALDQVQSHVEALYAGL